jgi:hypothetical protein
MKSMKGFVFGSYYTTKIFSVGGPTKEKSPSPVGVDNGPGWVGTGPKLQSGPNHG